ncbi:MAG: porin family protein [Alistipes sp.]|nr:porin family protein [Alistipes sp.]
MRSALRDAEATPPAEGWARLERALDAAPPRIPLWRRAAVRVAAVAALLAIGFGIGVLRRPAVPEAIGPSGIAEVAGSTVPAAGPVSEKTPADLLAAASSAGRVPAGAAAGAVRPAPPSAAPAGASAARTPVGGTDATEPGRANAAVSDSSSASAPQTGAASDRPARRSTSPVVSRRTSPAREFVAEAPVRRSKTAFSLFAAGGFSSRNVAHGLVSRSPLTLTDNGVEEEIFPTREYELASFRHHQPLGFGLAVRKEFGHGLSLETGVNYTLLWADVRMPFGTEEFSQKLHFIGVPVRANWNFLDRERFLLYIGAGFMVETCVSAKFGTASVDEPGAFWSALGAAGVEYRLGARTGLYCEPELSYSFNDTRLHTSRTDSPATFTLRLGVRVSF